MSSSRGSSRSRDQTRLLPLLHWHVGSLPLAPPALHYFSKESLGGCPDAYLTTPSLSVTTSASTLGPLSDLPRRPLRPAWNLELREAGICTSRGWPASSLVTEDLATVLQTGGPHAWKGWPRSAGQRLGQGFQCSRSARPTNSEALHTPFPLPGNLFFIWLTHSSAPAQPSPPPGNSFLLIFHVYDKPVITVFIAKGSCVLDLTSLSVKMLLISVSTWSLPRVGRTSVLAHHCTSIWRVTEWGDEMSYHTCKAVTT